MPEIPSKTVQELVALASEAMAAYQDRVRVNMQNKTLEGFIAALQQLPQNKITLKSIVAVGYEKSTGHLIFYQA